MKISIIGAAGCIGSCTAFNLATHGLADELVLIGGSHQDALRQHALDISTAMSTQDIVVRAGSYEDMAGSDIVISAAGVPQGIVTSRMEWLSANVALVQDIGKEIMQICPDAVVINATNPADPFNYAMYLMSSRRDRRKFIGYSANDTFRFRMMAAEALQVKPHRVDGIVIGEHGETQVLLFSSLKLDGKPVAVTDELKQKVLGQVPGILHTLETFKAKTGRTAGWTCAAGLAMICRAIKQDTREVLPCSAVLDGEYGYRDASITVPAVIGKDGVHQIKVLELTEKEREGLRKSVNFLSSHMRYVQEKLGIKK